MRSESRQSHPSVSHEARRASLELISFDTPFAGCADRAAIREYIESMTSELMDISLRADLPFVAYLLNLARQETSAAARQ